MTRKLGAVALLIALATTSAGALAATSGGGGGAEAQAAGQKKPIQFEDHDLFIETNATDRDAGLQADLDGEDWNRLRLRDPRGRVIVAVNARGPLRDLGLTELFFEASEPPFKEFPFKRFKRRFPEGKYTFKGRTVEGRAIAGSDKLSHVIPKGPVVTFPTEGAQANPEGFTATWEPVTRPAGVKIVRYIVVVTQGKRDMTLELPGTATRAAIPGEFLKAEAKTELEVLARSKSDNQTITAVEFRTK
jgi:hypothetical protein